MIPTAADENGAKNLASGPTSRYNDGRNGDVAQWQSTGLISRRLLVRIQSSPPQKRPILGVFFYPPTP